MRKDIKEVLDFVGYVVGGILFFVGLVMLLGFGDIVLELVRNAF